MSTILFLASLIRHHLPNRCSWPTPRKQMVSRKNANFKSLLPRYSRSMYKSTGRLFPPPHQKNSFVLKLWMFSLEGWRLFQRLFYKDLRGNVAKYCSWTNFKILKINLYFLSYKIPNPDPALPGYGYATLSNYCILHSPYLLNTAKSDERIQAKVNIF
jgi:hypothetical protein